MQMASSSYLFLSGLVVLFSISSAYTSNQNPIRIIKAVDVGDSEDLLKLNGMEAKNNQQSGKSQNVVVGRWEPNRAKPMVKHLDDGAYTRIRKTNLAYNKETAIGGLQVTYDLNSSPFVGANHTSFISGFTPVNISLDFPSEFIVEVSGYTSIVSENTIAHCLTFKTNEKTYGPNEITSGTPFNLPIENDLTIEFKGSIGY